MIEAETHIYEVRPRKDHRGVDLISDALPFGRQWYEDAQAAIGYAEFFGRSRDIEIRVYDDRGELTENRQYKGDFCEP
jgi:hypothetical protein